MRKLKLQMQLSIDGFVSGPNGEMDWMTWNWDDELKAYVQSLTDSVDCILLGRKLAEGFIPHWASNPEMDGAEKFNITPKIVFTKTLDTHAWANTRLAKGDLKEVINQLKLQEGKEMIVYGGVEYVSALLQYRLIDDLYLFINPVVLGEGKTIFAGHTMKQDYTLIGSHAFACGIVVLHYRPK